LQDLIQITPQRQSTDKPPAALNIIVGMLRAETLEMHVAAEHVWAIGALAFATGACSSPNARRAVGNADKLKTKCATNENKLVGLSRSGDKRLAVAPDGRER
jgi:hypothetical protein